MPALSADDGRYSTRQTKSNLSAHWDWSQASPLLLYAVCGLTVGPGLKLLGFKSRKELSFDDNIKHSYFIYPDEMVRTALLYDSQTLFGLNSGWQKTYSGSKRTFSALLKTMIKKKRIGLVLALMRRNSSPVFCAMLPQVLVFPLYRQDVSPRSRHIC